ncbi:MAG: shikimate dehydrogenase [Burkholderiales bacterium]
MTDQYAVIGNPIAHSKSPWIHAEFARQTGHDIAYGAILAPLDGFRQKVLEFRDAGGKGLNVTLPFKREAWELVDVRAGYALTAGAVNTIAFAGGTMTGYNTDGIGLVRDLQDNLRCLLRDKRLLLMGAGGATYGVMEPLLRERPRQIVVANRTLARAVALVEHFRKLQDCAADGIAVRPYEALRGLQFDLVINATSAGLDDGMPPLADAVFAAGALAYDMVYGRITPFLHFARQCGARIAEGSGMLVEQAAEAFFIWRGERPRTAPVIAKLKALL